MSGLLLLGRIEAADEEPSVFLKRERIAVDPARVVVPTEKFCAEHAKLAGRDLKTRLASIDRPSRVRFTAD